MVRITKNRVRIVSYISNYSEVGIFSLYFNNYILIPILRYSSNKAGRFGTRVVKIMNIGRAYGFLIIVIGI